MTISQVDGDVAAFSLYPASVEADVYSSTSRSSINVSPLRDTKIMSSIAKVVEMVSPSSSNNSNGAWTTPTLPKMTQPTTVEKKIPPPRVPVLSSSSSSPPIQEKNPPHNRKRRRNKSSNCIDNVGRGIWTYPLEDADGSDNINNIASSGDEIAWKRKIISTVLKGWCIIWVLFAILIISAELFSSNGNSGSRHYNNVSTKNIVIKIEDEQTFLEIAENVTSKCSYTNLKIERGREECQQLCFNHMCCFIDGSDADAQFEVHKYSCANDANKMCAAYAGCESLVVAEDDAIIYNANGVDVFEKKNTTDESTTNMDSSHEEQSQSVTNTTTTSSELQLIQQVITSVCHKDNLHSRHGINECASLCNPSMCCFNRTEIEILNPRMDIKLKMEGISNDILDRSVMGTCIHENESVGHRASIQNHFCNVHEGCQNILLLGAPMSTLEKNRQKYQYLNGGQSSAEDEEILIDYSGMIANSISGSNGNSITNDQERMLGTVFALLGIMVCISVFLLVHQRKPSENTVQLEMTTGTREEMIEFV